MVSFRSKGDFGKTDTYLKKLLSRNYIRTLEKYAKEGVIALASATPVDTGLTANSWSYEIVKTANGHSIYWKNSNINNGVSIALILQYGHGTRGGTFVQGRDYINPVIRPIFDKMSEQLRKEAIG